MASGYNNENNGINISNIIIEQWRKYNNVKL
jgi:hypothetical protein